jgi:hypothetical protein
LASAIAALPVSSLHGYEIDSDVPLTRAGAAPGELGRITVRAVLDLPLEAPAELVRLVVDADWNPHYAAARLGDRVLAWHSDAGSFVIDPASMSIGHRAADTVLELGPERWEDRLASNAIPLLLGELGGLSLHASANLIGDRAVVICGVTGRGKSTLSAALAAAGHPSLGEDGIVLRRSDAGHAAWPGATGSLLTEPAAELIGATSTNGDADPRGRRLHNGLRTADRPGQVALVAFLRERAGSAVEIERTDSAKTHRELLDHLLAADRLGTRDFAESARVAQSVHGLLLRVPDSLDAVAEAAERLAALTAEEHR